MSKQNLAITRKRPFPDCHYLAIPLLILGFVQGVSAQTWDSTISFSGSGNLDVSDVTESGDTWPLTASFSTIPGSTASTGVTTAIPYGGGFYGVSSVFNVFTDVTIPGSTTPATPVSISQPIFQGKPKGPDAGLTITGPTPPYETSGDSSQPFMGLFPPAAGTVFSGTDPNIAQYFFQYNPTQVIYVTFTGPLSLTLGDTPTLSTTPDPGSPGNDFYSYSYADSVLALSSLVNENDPPIDFIGPVVITTVATAPVAPAVPEPSTWLAGILLLGICGRGAWQKIREA